MKPEIKEKWLIALESGQYKKGTGFLKEQRGGEEITHCCLGVLCEIYLQETGRGEWIKSDGRSVLTFHADKDKDDSSEAVLPTAVKEWAGIPNENAEFYALSEDAKELKKLRSGIGASHCLSGVNDAFEEGDYSVITPLIRKYF